MARKWVVRIVMPYEARNDFERIYCCTLDRNPDLATFVKCLRYAGLVTTHESENFVMDLKCPAGLDSKAWAEMNAERMQTFGFNAVAAPKT